MNKSVLKAKNLYKNYGNIEILKDINLNIEQGEFVSIMGPSGSGKSTLLYVLSCLEKSTKGEIFIDEKNITSLNEKELLENRLQDVGFVFQQINLLKNLNVIDNIILPGYMSKKLNKKEVNEKAREYLKVLGIEKTENKELSDISGGEMQRVAIARALINNPKIIFLDEPTGALNSKAASEVLNILNILNNEGKTLLIVTHDLKVAARAERLIYLTDGKITGQLKLGKYNSNESKEEREKKVSEYLFNMGW